MNPYEPPAEIDLLSEHRARVMAELEERGIPVEIFDRVADALVDALGVDLDEILPSSRLVEDLGAY